MNTEICEGNKPNQQTTIKTNKRREIQSQVFSDMLLELTKFTILALSILLIVIRSYWQTVFSTRMCSASSIHAERSKPFLTSGRSFPTKNGVNLSNACIKNISLMLLEHLTGYWSSPKVVSRAAIFMAKWLYCKLLHKDAVWHHSPTRI